MEPRYLYRYVNLGAKFVVNDKFIDFVSEHVYVIVAHQGERFDKLLSRLPDKGRVRDWDWVKVNTEFRNISSDTTAQRIYIFRIKN